MFYKVPRRKKREKLTIFMISKKDCLKKFKKRNYY